MKYALFSIVAALSMFSAIADASIANVTARQRYPWNGKVDISYSTKNIEAKAKEEGLMVSLKVTAIDQDAGTTNVATTLSGDMSLADGTHKIVWDMNAQGLDIKSTNVVFTVSCEAETALYCIVDLSTGSSGASFPVSFTNEIPSGSWGDEYKTTKLVLRRIEPGSCVVTISKPYYIGVFETTQKQYLLITGGNPSCFPGDKRPVERVSYNDIRGADAGSQYPKTTEVDENSFMGKIRGKTGMHFDLPTKDESEYACRAGTTTKYSYGTYANKDYMWYGSGECHHEVGTLLPNQWGLYDVHGNIDEWCLNAHYFPEWYLMRVHRGGNWGSSADDCASSAWKSVDPSYTQTTLGFRVVINLK